MLKYCNFRMECVPNPFYFFTCPTSISFRPCLAERRHRFCNSDVTVLGPNCSQLARTDCILFRHSCYVTQLEMTFLEICFLAAVSDDALKDKIGSIRPSHLQRSDAHRCSFAVVGTLGYSFKKYLSSQEKDMFFDFKSSSFRVYSWSNVN